MSKILEQDIKSDLMDQLVEKGLENKRQYVSLVDDYVSLWKVKNMLIADIEERGVNVEYNNGGGQTGHKRNDSVGELNRTNAQMLKLLSELGLSAANIEKKEEPVKL